ncbi:MAG: beta-mannosidase [Ruminococcus sp.]|nr:beta-mannosidase [Ruminococcus sp.]
MKISLKRLAAAISAAAMTAVSTGTALAPAEAADTVFPLKVEGENMKGADTWTSVYETQIPGYSGEGFAYIQAGDISFNVTVPEDGMYSVHGMVAQVLNQEGRTETLDVNGKKYVTVVPYLDKWTDFDFGTVRLNKGENTISFTGSYGYMELDYATVTVAEPHDYAKASGVCCDPRATKETQSLMSYLKSVYGKNILTGQQEIYGSGHKDNYEWENDFIKDLTGKVPAVRGLDFMNYNPLYGWDDGTTERAIAWAKERNGILTASWHINVPIDFENYTLGDEVDWQKCTYKNYQASNGTFNTANVIKEGTKEREYFEEAMKLLAEQLGKLQDENVPIIFRPLHEAQGNDGRYGDGTAWFWWGDRGAEVYKELWKLLYTTLTEEYGLHNIIWEFNAYELPSSPDWYPGDEYVDIIAYDKYNANGGPNLSAISDVFNALYNMTDGGKMIAMAENDTIPAVDNMTVEDAYWLYVCPWYDGGEDGGVAFLGENYQDYDEFKKFYQSDVAITLDELPEDLYTSGGTSEPATKPATTPAEENTTVPVTTVSSTGSSSDTFYGDANLDKKITVADAVAVLQYIANQNKYALSEQALINADIDGEAGITGGDAITIQKVDAGLVKQTALPLKAGK